MSESAPGFQKHPGYQVEITPTSDHIRILSGKICLADSQRPIQVTETKHRPVWYLPLADVDSSIIVATDHSTYCPFKGHASYWSVKADAASVDDASLENSIWGYLNPYTECEPLLNHVAFYTDRLTLEVNGITQDESGPGWTS